MDFGEEYNRKATVADKHTYIYVYDRTATRYII